MPAGSFHSFALAYLKSEGVKLPAGIDEVYSNAEFASRVVCKKSHLLPSGEQVEPIIFTPLMGRQLVAIH
uniref:Uncharacterized protein n=1 Tax=Knipowitschia caucasica TaxID=637954 RepID=A0AAV2KKQ8_KNICA